MGNCGSGELNAVVSAERQEGLKTVSLENGKPEMSLSFVLPRFVSVRLIDAGKRQGIGDARAVLYDNQ